MAKRLRDTEMWSKEWFRNLSTSAKLFWIYILDKCSFAGIYEIDFELAKFFTKAKIDETTLNELSKQFIKIDEKRIFIKDFIDFQYGKIHETHKMKNKIMAELSKYSIPYPIDTLSDYDNRVSSISDTVKDKEEDKDMVKDNSFVLGDDVQEKCKHEKPVIPQHLEKIWPEFLEMRKKNRKPATDYAQIKLLEKLKTLAAGNAGDEVRIVEQSIMHSWQGFFPLSDSNHVSGGLVRFQKFGRQTVTNEMLKEQQIRVRELEQKRESIWNESSLIQQ